MEKYGFVYVWRDKKHNRYYVGRHWGTEDDGYICSQANMRNNLRNRLHDFKRRIVSRVYDKDELVLEEQRWLDMIRPEECGNRYYNRTLKATTPSMRGRTHSEETKQKMRLAATDRKHTEETKEKIRNIRTGTTLSENTKKKIGKNSSAARDYNCPIFRKKMSLAARNRSDETRAKISENNKRLQAEGKIGMMGKKHSPETIEKMKRAQKDAGAKKFLITYPSGEQETIFNLRKFCSENNLHDGHMISVAKERQKQHKGYLCSYI